MSKKSPFPWKIPKTHPDAELLGQIRAYLVARNIGHAAFGADVLKDSGAITAIVGGREIRRDTRSRIEVALVNGWNVVASLIPPEFRDRAQT